MRILFFTIIVILHSYLINGQSLIAKNSEIEKAGTGFIFTEGPAVAPDGKVYFTDQPNDCIHVWDEQNGISFWLKGTRRSNGMYFNAKGQLIACADLYNQLGYFDKDKTFNLIYERYKGKLLNGPNDLWVTPKDRGHLFFRSILSPQVVE